MALCDPGADWSPRSKADVISDIESGAHSYFVDRGGYKVDVGVVEGPYGKYLSTVADPSSKNNLENLPDCHDNCLVC